MQWIKSHLTIVVCGSIGLVSLVMLVLGILLTNLQEAMAQDESLYSSLTSMKSKPVNARVIEEVRSQQRKVKEQVDRFLKEAVATAEHKPLLADVFPMFKGENERFAFSERFRQKQLELIRRLNAKDQPSDADVIDYRENLERELQKEKRLSGETAVNPFGGPAPLVTEPSAVDLSKLTPEELVQKDPLAGASVKRAREIYMYASVSSLDPKFSPDEKYPSIESMWMAQVGLWIQEDIINALARVNEQEAERQKLPPEERWVGTMPVKHLLYILISDYVSAAAGSPAGGFAAGPTTPGELPSGPPPGLADAVFTKRGSTSGYDVVHLAMGLVIDARAMLTILDEISKSGFYTPLSVSYEVVDYDPSLRGYVYGSGPVIRVRIEYECCMLREKYREWMPETLKSPDRQPVGAGAGSSYRATPYGGSPYGGRTMPMGRPSGRSGRGLEDY